MFTKCRLLSLIALLVLAGCARMTSYEIPPATDELRVLTFNILMGGTELGQPLSQTAKVITDSGANVAILQEQNGSAKRIARMLKWNVHVVSKSVAILSPYPLAERHVNGAAVEYAPGALAHVFGCHLEAYPYGPYDLRDDPALAPEVLIATATETRGHQIGPILKEMAPFIARGEPVYLGGDFNEPSHLDWCEAASAAGLHFARAVAWPTSTSVTTAGMTDAYRAICPDAVAHTGETWTPLPEANEVHDRIDKIYFSGMGVIPTGAQIVGEDTAHADIEVTPYPSDHRAVLATFKISVP